MMPQYDHFDLNNWPSAEKDIGEFWRAQQEEYMKHYLKQGDSWKTCEVQWLVNLAERAMVEFFDDTDNGIIENPSHLLDIANFCAFLYLRLSPNSKGETKDGS